MNPEQRQSPEQTTLLEDTVEVGDRKFRVITKAIAGDKGSAQYEIEINGEVIPLDFQALNLSENPEASGLAAELHQETVRMLKEQQPVEFIKREIFQMATIFQEIFEKHSQT
jgi:hypothetical protein